MQRLAVTYKHRDWPGPIHTLHLRLVALGFPHHQCGSFAIEGIGGVGVAEELRQKDFEDVDHVVHGRPRLIDNIEADGAGPG